MEEELMLLEFLEWFLKRMDIPIEGNENIYIKEYLESNDDI